jgi:hypothetical protein
VCSAENAAEDNYTLRTAPPGNIEQIANQGLLVRFWPSVFIHPRGGFVSFSHWEPLDGLSRALKSRLIREQHHARTVANVCDHKVAARRQVQLNIMVAALRCDASLHDLSEEGGEASIAAFFSSM